MFLVRNLYKNINVVKNNNKFIINRFYCSTNNNNNNEFKQQLQNYKNELNKCLENLKNQIQYQYKDDGSSVDKYNQFKKEFEQSVTFHEYLGQTPYPLYQYILKQFDISQYSNNIDIKRNLWLDEMIRNHLNQSEENYALTCSNLMFYNELINQEYVCRKLERDSFGTLDSSQLDILLNRLILLSLKSGYYHVALKWLSKRILDYSHLDSSKSIQFFIRYHKERSELDLVKFWQSPLDQMEWNKLTKEDLEMYDNLKPDRIFKRISSYCNDNIKELKDLPVFNDNILDDLMKQVKIKELIKYLREVYFSNGLFPPGQKLIESLVLIYKLEPIEYFKNMVSSKSVPNYIGCLMYEWDLSTMIEMKFDEGIQRATEEGFLKLEDLPGSLWNSVLAGLLNYGQYTLASSVLSKLIENQIPIQLEKKYLQEIYEHCNFDYYLVDFLIKSNNSKNRDLLSDCILKYLVDKGYTEWSIDYFEKLKFKNSNCIREILKLYSKISPVPPRENLTIWQSLDKYVLDSTISVENFNEMMINQLYISNNRDIIETIINRNAITIHEQSQKTCLQLLKSLNNSQDQIKIFKQFRKESIYDREIIEIITKANREIKDLIIEKFLNTSISYSLLEAKSRDKIEISLNSLKFLF
ncbi:hypothetical protein DLAC_05819 [Tieghemostelium lacteum]|uniref:Uncharacterized protein n=1 Tax=Tieghemostelium lacteum TaxID=361077 RepID=A0A151ZGT9_TIELA|nr:hypothetical protein DLAC_05819 [Tieghemostelium lacteum]|eukprot:KYQ93183.1 hypothetical protein DLAC_05819 [Tieghemostelium lacteum]